MKSVLQKMLSQLSEADQHSFAELAKKLQLVNGDISQLSASDRQLIEVMENRYDNKLNESISSADELQEQSVDESDFLLFPFAGYVKQILARDLGEHFPLENEAVAFAFENKWLPVDCQNQELVELIFDRFEEDVVEINRWRNSLLDATEDKKMAVGLAWFMVIFQLNAQLNPAS